MMEFFISKFDRNEIVIFMKILMNIFVLLRQCVAVYLKYFANSWHPAQLVSHPGTVFLQSSYHLETLEYLVRSNLATSYDEMVATKAISATVIWLPAAYSDPVKKVSKNPMAVSIALNFSGSAGCLAKTCG